jgi:uncharacterized protein (TIGR02722 family)
MDFRSSVLPSFRSSVLAAAAVGGAALLAGGCASTPMVAYGDANAVQSVTTEFSSTDLQMIASKMVDSMLTFPPVMEVTATRRPIISVDRVKNKTMQHVDTESITDTIRTKLLRSGKFRFVDRTTDDVTAAELKAQNEGGLTDPNKAVAFGQQEAAEYIVTGNFSEITQTAGRVSDVYYKFTLNLKNLRTGILEWSDEKEIRKTSKTSVIGF